MIGSFWNLCRACPSMPVDKLHSEYRSTYKWHEYVGQEVVHRPPQPSASGANPSKLQTARSMEEDNHVAVPRFEPAIPRRKKHPELAYRTHEFLAMSEAGGSDDSLESTVAFDRARSEERGGAHIRPSRRSKSEGPPTTAGAPPGPALSEYRLQYMNMASPPPRAVRSDSDPCVDEEMMIASYPPPAPAGPLSNAIARISTEYRLQFAWPRAGRGLSTQDAKITTGSVLPRKSLSMGAIQPVPVHKKRGADFEKNDEGASELEPLVGPEVVDTTLEELQGEEKIQHEILSKEEKPRRRKEIKTEYKKKFRPFSQYDYVEGKFLKKADAVHLPDAMPELPQSDSWYREVLELRKKAGEYKHRGWGTELVPQHIADLYNKQMALWEQVSRRSSLSALSLASTAPRSISKEEKEKENNKKSSPTKPMSSRPMRPSTAPDKFQENDKRKAEKGEITKKEIPRSRKDYLIRHHLERTTGAVDGALLPSPTREKLEPVIPRQKEEDLPKSPQKASPKSSPRSARSQSVGLTGDNRSPKRQPRTPLATTTQPNKMNGPVQTERRPRPSSAACGENENDVDQQLNKEEPEVEPALVKSPPEPTRVKSPEQILMRSPEPVNWTVPLDTGKTFTVTQNVHEAMPNVKLYRGELTNRPHSEVKPWTPPTVPPPAPQSAPPELLEQTSGWKSPDPMTTSIVGGHEAVNGLEEEKPSTLPFQYDTSTAGTAFRHQEGPSFDKGRSGSELLETPTEMSAGSAGGGSSQDPYRILEASASTLPQESPTKPLPLVSPSSGRSLASDVLEKARTRFDKFWGKGKEPTDGKV
ncbi:serine/arginine repetitive matrix protein 1 isoform X8 [Cryptotermes secundus]|uniref:serine/arginine repetitive matrix protein 1 isoform X8 n=1 Tax=Cryptotermes secundus TaxID=105785 RepID=UPI001454DCC8|nr:serine/arginine repetitive matrix protein 1 isoform X8 [Cryptotermes secundus]